MVTARKDNEFDVIIVGGGITGAGTARDCALRGLKVLLSKGMTWPLELPVETTACFIAVQDMP